MMGLVKTILPTADPVSLADMKEWLKIEYTDDDCMIESLISAATSYAEKVTNRQLGLATFEQTMDSFPGGLCLTLKRAPLISVTSVTYLDENASSQTLPSNTYFVDATTPYGSITLDDDSSWPDTVRDRPNAVTIEFEAGYVETPFEIRTAIKLLVAQWYEERSGIVGSISSKLPQAVDALLSHWQLPGVY